LQFVGDAVSGQYILQTGDLGQGLIALLNGLCIEVLDMQDFGLDALYVCFFSFSMGPLCLSVELLTTIHGRLAVWLGTASLLGLAIYGEC